MKYIYNAAWLSYFIIMAILSMPAYADGEVQTDDTTQKWWKEAGWQTQKVKYDYDIQQYVTIDGEYQKLIYKRFPYQSRNGNSEHRYGLRMPGYACEDRYLGLSKNQPLEVFAMRYRDAEEQQLKPPIIFIHGGGWFKQRDVSDNINKLYENIMQKPEQEYDLNSDAARSDNLVELMRQGYTVFAVEYPVLEDNLLSGIILNNSTGIDTLANNHLKDLLNICVTCHSQIGENSCSRILTSQASENQCGANSVRLAELSEDLKKLDKCIILAEQKTDECASSTEQETDECTSSTEQKTDECTSSAAEQETDESTINDPLVLLNQAILSVEILNYIVHLNNLGGDSAEELQNLENLKSFVEAVQSGKFADVMNYINLNAFYGFNTEKAFYNFVYDNGLGAFGTLSLKSIDINALLEHIKHLPPKASACSFQTSHAVTLGIHEVFNQTRQRIYPNIDSQSSDEWEANPYHVLIPTSEKDRDVILYGGSAGAQLSMYLTLNPLRGHYLMPHLRESDKEFWVRQTPDNTQAIYIEGNLDGIDNTTTLSTLQQDPAFNSKVRIRLDFNSREHIMKTVAIAPILNIRRLEKGTVLAEANFIAKEAIARLIDVEINRIGCSEKAINNKAQTLKNFIQPIADEIEEIQNSLAGMSDAEISDRVKSETIEINNEQLRTLINTIMQEAQKKAAIESASEATTESEIARNIKAMNEIIMGIENIIVPANDEAFEAAKTWANSIIEVTDRLESIQSMAGSFLQTNNDDIVLASDFLAELTSFTSETIPYTDMNASRLELEGGYIESHIMNGESVNLDEDMTVYSVAQNLNASLEMNIPYHPETDEDDPFTPYLYTIDKNVNLSKVQVPPFYILQGEADSTVPYYQALHFCLALAEHFKPNAQNDSSQGSYYPISGKLEDDSSGVQGNKPENAEEVYRYPYKCGHNNYKDGYIVDFYRWVGHGEWTFPKRLCNANFVHLMPYTLTNTSQMVQAPKDEEMCRELTQQGIRQVVCWINGGTEQDCLD